MPTNESFNAFLCEQLAPLGHVTVRRMFSAAGIFCNGLMFGLIRDEALYIRIDDQTLTEFSHAESAPPFTYSRNGRIVDLPYRRVPEDLLDQPEELIPWAEAGIAAARRKPVKTKRTAPPRKIQKRRAR
jgi:DNA transformation protein and related proteins